jgi:hypothetical protein
MRRTGVVRDRLRRLMTSRLAEEFKVATHLLLKYGTSAAKLILSLIANPFRWLYGRITIMAAWLRENGAYTFISADCIGGILVSVGIGVGSIFDHRFIPGPAVQYGEIAIATAILSVALIALSILVAFLGEDYVKLLRESVGMSKAILPYQTVATVSAVAILTSLLSVLSWPIAPYWAQDLASSVAAGLTTWAIIGTVQIVNITARHGRRRARMPEIPAAAKEALKNRPEAS